MLLANIEHDHSDFDRDRAKRADSEAEKETFAEFGKTVHDITSVASLNSAFEDCREDDAYDLCECQCRPKVSRILLNMTTAAVWQLVGLSLWFIDFLERLMQQCVYLDNEVDDVSAPGSPGKPYVRPPSGGNVSALVPKSIGLICSL